MIRYFGKAFKITNENIILATPLVLFLLLLSIYIGVAQNAPVNILSASLLSITTVLMVSAFFAGWLYMVKKAIDLDKQEFIAEDDKAKASFSLIKEFPIGIGEYFLSFIGLLVIYVLLFLLVTYITYLLGMHFIGKVGINLGELKIALGSATAMKSLISSLSTEQLQKLNAWNFLYMMMTATYSFLTMFWGAEITFRTKNALRAFFRAIKFTFKNFLSALVLFIYVSFINFIISFINALSTVNPILYFISMIIYFYFLVYIVVLIFFYYDQESRGKIKFIDEDKFIKQIESETEEKSDSDSGADSDGQEQAGDSDSAEE